MENRIRQRLMMQQTFREQLAFKQMQRQREKEEEEAFRKTMMAKFAEDDRIEQMNAQRRRMKQLEHKHEVERLMEERRRQRETERVPTIIQKRRFVSFYTIRHSGEQQRYSCLFSWYVPSR